MSVNQTEDNRGRQATSPWHIPPLGWRDISWRVWRELKEDNISMVAAAVAFYVMLSLFPSITALGSIYGLLADPADVQVQLSYVKDIMPEQAWGLINDQLTSVAAAGESKLGWSALTGILLALWTAGAGVRAMMTALNIAYDETEKRNILVFYFYALLITLGGIITAVVALTTIVAVPVVMSYLRLYGPAQEYLPSGFITSLRWPVMALMVFLGILFLYRFSVSRNNPRTRWAIPGALLSSMLWIVVSMLFSFFVSKFGNYDETYGAMGAVVILMLWFWISTYVILLGAEFNAEIEHQTHHDTTVGSSRDLGDRGAYVADNIGPVP